MRGRLGGEHRLWIWSPPPGADPALPPTGSGLRDKPRHLSGTQVSLSMKWSNIATCLPALLGREGTDNSWWWVLWRAMLLLGRDRRIWGQGHVGVHVCAPVHNGGGAQARRVEIRGIREITGITGRVRFPGTRDVRVGALGPLVDYVENNILILRVGKLRPRERRHQPQVTEPEGVFLQKGNGE